MSAAQLHEFEARFNQLSVDEQCMLLGRLAADHRQKHGSHWDAQLAAMAADPDIQRELRAIEQEFAETEQDGLENVRYCLGL